MSKNYDNWERLVRAVLLREQFKELSLLSSPSRSTCPSSISSFRSTFQQQNQAVVPSQRSSRNLATQSRSRTNSGKLPGDYSDLVIDHTEWKAMLPPGQDAVVWRSSSMRLFLDKNTGKNRFTLGARQLLFSPAHSNASNFEEWVSNYPDSRFPYVAKIKDSYYVFIGGRIKALMLSPKTFYAAYLVFHQPEFETGGSHLLIFGLAITTCELAKGRKQGMELILRPEDINLQTWDQRNQLVAVRRDDGWMEVKIGDVYVNRGGENGEVEARLLMIDNMSPLIVEGIEFRPKYTETQLVSRGNKKGKEKGFFSSSKIEMIWV